MKITILLKQNKHSYVIYSPDIILDHGRMAVLAIRSNKEQAQNCLKEAVRLAKLHSNLENEYRIADIIKESLRR